MYYDEIQYQPFMRAGKQTKDEVPMLNSCGIIGI